MKNCIKCGGEGFRIYEANHSEERNVDVYIECSKCGHKTAKMAFLEQSLEEWNKMNSG